MPLNRPLEDFPDESPLGYYRRLAQKNAYESWRDLAHVAGISATPSGLMGNPGHLSSALGLDPAWTTRVAERDVKWRSAHRFLRLQHDAVCPQCLRDAEYLRIEWDHVYVVACHKHRSMLIEHCPRCKEPLSKQRPRIEYCDCGHDLRGHTCEAASDELIWVAQVIGKADVRANWTGPKLQATSLTPISEMIQTLCTFHTPSVKGVRRNSSERRRVQDAANFLGALAPLLLNWPAGFHRHVQMRLQAADPAARTLNGALGIWYQRLKRSSLQCPGAPFLQEIINAVTSYSPFLLSVDGTRSKTGGPLKILTLRDAAERLGLRRDTLARAIEKGAVKARNRRFGTRRLMYQIDEAEVLRLENTRCNWIDEAEALKILDVPASVFKILKEVGVVQFDPNWRSDVGKCGPVLIKSLSDLHEGIRSRVDRSCTESDTLALRDISSRRIRDKQELKHLYQAIANGEVCGVGRLPAIGVGDVRFRREDVARFTGSTVLEAGLSIERLADLTGWHYESISHWIALGLLGHSEIVLRGQKCRVVLPEHIVAFMRNYLPLADAAKAVGTTASGLSKRMQAIQPVGAKSVSANTGRGGLIPMSQLINMALNSVTDMENRSPLN
jgi:hypothetical protein